MLSYCLLHTAIKINWAGECSNVKRASFRLQKDPRDSPSSGIRRERGGGGSGPPGRQHLADFPQEKRSSAPLIAAKTLLHAGLWRGGLALWDSPHPEARGHLTCQFSSSKQMRRLHEGTKSRVSGPATIRMQHASQPQPCACTVSHPVGRDLPDASSPHSWAPPAGYSCGPRRGRPSTQPPPHPRGIQRTCSCPHGPGPPRLLGLLKRTNG